MALSQGFILVGSHRKMVRVGKPEPDTYTIDRATQDIRESIQELKYYKETFFKSS